MKQLSNAIRIQQSSYVSDISPIVIQKGRNKFDKLTDDESHQLRALARQLNWVAIFIETLLQLLFLKQRRAYDYNHAETKKKSQITIAKQRRGRMLNVLLLLFQKIIKQTITVNLSLCGWWLMLY